MALIFLRAKKGIKHNVMSIDRIKELNKELKKMKLKEGFIDWASEHYGIHSLTIRTNYLSRFNVPSKRGFQKTFINDIETYIKRNKRSEAIKWWRGLEVTDKSSLIKDNFEGRHPLAITGREIEMMWFKSLKYS